MRLPLLVHDPPDLLLIEALLVEVLEELNQLLHICLEFWLGIVHLRHLLLPELVLHLSQVKVHDQLLVIGHGDLVFTGILREVLQLGQVPRSTLRGVGWVLRELKALLDVFHQRDLIMIGLLAEFFFDARNVRTIQCLGSIKRRLLFPKWVLTLEGIVNHMNVFHVFRLSDQRG